jgi:hypothetical protein
VEALRESSVYWLTKGGRLDSIRFDSDRTFLTSRWPNDAQWTWELFEAQFTDKPDIELLIGRWPD